MKNEIPRRNRIDRMTPGELAIREAIRVVEEMGADIRLTNVVVRLSQAQEVLADYVDATTPLT